jgi:hypothetical protein
LDRKGGGVLPSTIGRVEAHASGSLIHVNPERDENGRRPTPGLFRCGRALVTPLVELALF